MNILITGAGGALGEVFTQKALKEYPDARITAVGYKGVLSDRHNAPRLDLTRKDSWRKLDLAYNLIFHLAARIFPGKEGTSHSPLHANCAMANLLYDACLRWKPERVVYASSISVYPPDLPEYVESIPPSPATPYGVSKLYGEHILDLTRQIGTQATSLRFSSIYGVGQLRRFSNTVLNLFIERVLQKKQPVIHGTGERVQDFLHVDDACVALLAAAESGQSGPFNVGSGVPVSMKALAEAVIRHIGVSGLSADFLPEKPDGGSVRLNVEKARQCIGFKAGIDIDAGLKNIVRQLKNA